MGDCEAREAGREVIFFDFSAKTVTRISYAEMEAMMLAQEAAGVKVSTTWRSGGVSGG